MQGPLKGPGRFFWGCFNALSCFLSHIFKHSDKRNWIKNIVDQILGGRLLPPPPPWIRHCVSTVIPLFSRFV